MLSLVNVIKVITTSSCCFEATLCLWKWNLIEEAVIVKWSLFRGDHYIENIFFKIYFSFKNGKRFSNIGIKVLECFKIIASNVWSRSNLKVVLWPTCEQPNCCYFKLEVVEDEETWRCCINCLYYTLNNQLFLKG